MAKAAKAKSPRRRTTRRPPSLRLSYVPILTAIAGVEQRVLGFTPTTAEQITDRRQALLFLSALRELVQALCFHRDSEESYYIHSLG